jgi:hypothetical protein
MTESTAQALPHLPRDVAVAHDPRLAHVDAIIRNQGDGHLDLWSRHASQSSHRFPAHHIPLEWIENGLVRSLYIGSIGEQQFWVSFRFDLVDGRVLCSIEISHDGEIADAWYRDFRAQWDPPWYDADSRLDAALQCGTIPARSRAAYEQVVEEMRAEGRRKMEAEMAAYEIKRANRPPPLASAEQVAAGIPVISDDELAARHAKLRPLVRIGDDLCFIVDPTDLRAVSFIWSPVAADKSTGLSPATTVVTLHTYGAPVCFKPSIAEVLAQAPEDWQTYAAYSIEGPEDAEALNRDHEATHAGYHVAVVTYYREQP